MAGQQHEPTGGSHRQPCRAAIGVSPAPSQATDTARSAPLQQAPCSTAPQPDLNGPFHTSHLATESPQTIDAINRYPPEVALNAVAFVGFVVGFLVLGVAMAKTGTFPRLSGLLVAVGAPCQVVGFALGQLVSPALWILAILGSMALGAGLAWPGYRMWQHPAS